jgi:diguanylate cyclase (GGDEF)-like protein/PAS domain S-box-containing protein
MNQIVLCLTTQHDLGLVVVAGLVSFLSAAVGYDLLARAKVERRALWLCAAAVVTGSGIWATHFIAMLAYDPGVTLAYGIATTAASGVSGTVISGLGFALMIHGAKDRVVPALAGAIIGGGVAVLHYVGMAALIIPATIVWDWNLVAASIAVGCALGAVSGYLFQRATRVRGRLAAALALTLAVCSHHFTAMGAVTILPDASIGQVTATLPKLGLVAAIVATMVVILLLGILGGTFDRILATRRQREAKRLNTLANAAFEGIVICRDGEIVDANESFRKLVGKAAGEVLGRRFVDMASAAGRERVAAAIDDDARSAISIDLLNANGDAIPVEVLKRVSEGEGGAHVILAVRDLRERKEAESRIRFLAHHDSLTGLANRSFFGIRLEDAIARAERSGGLIAVHYIDLDRFKDVNDSLGHAAGDTVLETAARRLEDLAKSGDIVARLGGDEFVIAQVDLPGSEAAIAFAERICARIAEPIVFDHQSLIKTASVGVAVFPMDGKEAETLTQAADMALYRAKEEGRATFRAFETEIAERVQRRRELQRDLQKAILAGELRVHYQPQVRVKDGELLGFEALVRWTHPKQGIVPPSTFIPLAEESGCIWQLGEWVLRSVCAEASRWRRPLNVAVNLSPIQIIQGDLPHLVQTILLETGMKAHLLELEVTESVLIKDIDRALHVLRRLKSLGVKIAMDDFGTGYSSLSYLQSFPFDKLKIDRSFIQNLDQNAHSRAIVRAVVGLGRALSLPVVAEGVESNMQLDVLRIETCEEVQGFLTGRPQPIEAFEAFLMSEGPNVRAFASVG